MSGQEPDWPALGFRRPEPRPFPECGTCRRPARRRHAAREAAGLSAVTDANVLLRRHQRRTPH